MIQILIPYDNEDASRGEYFTASQEDFTSKIADLENIVYNLLTTQQCLSNTVDTFIANLNENSFILIGYLHGNDEELLVSTTSYINTRNAYYFANSLFYACSCSAANTLGKELMNNGCKIFLGYNSTISTVKNETEPIFYHCENAFLVHFVSTNSTIQECLGHMYDEYERMKIHLSKNHGIFDASILEENLMAFEILYDEEVTLNLTKEYFDN